MATATLIRRYPSEETFVLPGKDGWFGGLRGSGPMLVFETRIPRNSKFRGELWRIVRGKTRRIHSSPFKLTVLAVDQKRVVALRSDGVVELVNGNGRGLVRFAVRGRIRGAGLVGSRAVFVTGNTFDVHELHTGRRVARWPLGGASARRRFAGVAGEIAAYTERRTIHFLRLTDGRRGTIKISGTGTVDAALTSGGLFYSILRTRAPISGPRGVPARERAPAAAPLSRRGPTSRPPGYRAQETGPH